VPYLIGLAEGVPTAAYAESYANIVREKAVLRDLIGASGRILQSAYEQAAPLEQLLDQAESAIFELSTSKRRTFFEGMPQLVSETFQSRSTSTSTTPTRCRGCAWGSRSSTR
jgi:replicative DNA helicase